MAKVKKKRKPKPKLSPEQKKQKKLQTDHKSMVRSVFRQAGFRRIASLSDKQFTYDGQKTDFDDVYVFENILVCLEYTTTASENIGSHLKPKKIVYDKIDSDNSNFCDFYCGINSELKEALLDDYNTSEIIVRIVYCSRNAIEPHYKTNVPNPIYLDYAILRYFKSITDCIKNSARFELFDFLGIEPSALGTKGKVGVSAAIAKYPGSLLPETSSNFDPGFKVVSFYVDPEALLKRAYVLRKEGWRDSHSMYQRMITKGKIDSIRKYLRSKKRVFVNNIIATLSDETKIVDGKGNTVDPKNINTTKPVEILIPDRINTIGLIDGQHRTYSYYESTLDDTEIAKLRVKQNLLLTGIIYPDHISDGEKEKFEARLFLEINSNQTNAKSNLKQAIGLVLEPFSAESIATRVLNALDKSTGPLHGQIERYWFDQNKLKTTSIVSYALKPLVKTSGADSLFSLWANSKKSLMVPEEDHNLLAKYVEHCVSEINQILSAAKHNLPINLWTPDKAIEGRMLTTTNINSLLICLRLLIENNKAGGFDYYKQQLAGLSGFKFKDYHSSQYNRMAEAIYAQFFASA